MIRHWQAWDEGKRSHLFVCDAKTGGSKDLTPKLDVNTPPGPFGGSNDYASRVFGRSTRETNCDCNRSNDPNLLQSIYLQNDQEMAASLNNNGGWLAERVGPKRALLVFNLMAIAGFALVVAIPH